MSVPTPQSFALYPAEHPRMAANIKNLLEKRRTELLEELMTAPDWGSFCERRGKIHGIDEAMQHALDVEQKLNERQR
jgi:hypothetical protein